ncbi:DUF4976 domain-containing protein [Actinobacteria bacterium YIM 96077]|uniref:Sulfatase N-terminal domain-containing protein n=1 Tax=Phytoactinopolyspora halophila TaxID=1981511 RepID=A0A329QBQ7_9ACTN|nr:sulfatase-like hydrolase/transferase [Phytoactinopolyspora halophila]AYY11819.1 DUF4976 domain-containing protein [Actinobacteria bacterium YIM 96077]RAW09840.1 hypothetical protein DPM12_20055 [Phytoactinopolyspora halophila]
MSDRPNIVWLFSDQHRADVLGAAGHPVVRTPHLDRLAEEGVLFDDAYCQAPLCVPARVSLLTERYVRDHGAFDNDCEPRSDLPTLPQAIRNVGYDTVAVGKMHLFPTPGDLDEGLGRMRELGFTEVYEEIGKLSSGLVRTGYTDYLAAHGYLETYREFMRERSPLIRMGRADDPDYEGKPTWVVDPCPLPPEHYLDAYVGRQAARWIDSRSESDPFFLWVGFPGPHDPWDAPDQYVEKYRDDEIPLDSTKRPEVPGSGPLSTLLNTFLDYSSSDTLTDQRIREVRRHYYANVTVIDDAIGEIVAALERQGLDENTWIVYSADHGEMLGTHGLLNKMVFYDPAVRVPLVVRPPGGASSGRRVSGLVEHVDLSATLRAIAGADEIPDGAGRSFRDVFSGSDVAGRDHVISENHGFAMFRTNRYKLVIYERDLQPVQLFDLHMDPIEDHDLVDDPAYQEVVADLMNDHVRPFLATQPARPGPDLVERSGRMGLGLRDTSPQDT